MKRKVKKYGNTAVIKLEPKDLEDLGLEIDDDVDISKIKKIKKGKNKDA